MILTSFSTTGITEFEWIAREHKSNSSYLTQMEGQMFLTENLAPGSPTSRSQEQVALKRISSETVYTYLDF
jgi:hypothetical protein